MQSLVRFLIFDQKPAGSLVKSERPTVLYPAVVVYRLLVDDEIYATLDFLLRVVGREVDDSVEESVRPRTKSRAPGYAKARKWQSGARLSAAAGAVALRAARAGMARVRMEVRCNFTTGVTNLASVGTVFSFTLKAA